MADSEITKLQEELKAAIEAEKEEDEPKRITFKTHSPEGDLVTKTIKKMLSDMDKMNRAHEPFEQRVKKAKTLFNYIMANPNIIAYSTKLRQVSINKAHEMLEGDYSKYDDTKAASQLQGMLRHFLAWTEETLPCNVHYSE
jgi:hypothetical protein